MKDKGVKDVKPTKLFGIACFLGGMVAGFLISPIKKGMYFGNNCGNHVENKGELEEDKKLNDDIGLNDIY